MVRTFIAALVGTTALGMASANAMFLDKSDIQMIVKDQAPSMALSQNDADGVYIVTNHEGSGERVDGFTAYVNLEEGGTKVLVFDENGSVERTYIR